MNLLIPEIESKIEKVLKKLDLIADVSPIEFIKKTKGMKHRYYTACSTKEGEKMLFYSRLYTSEYDKKRFITEILLAQKIISKELCSEYFPGYYRYDIEEDFEWLTREYYKVSPLENKKRIERVKKNLSDRDILKIVKAIIDVNGLSIKKLDFLSKFNTEKYSNFCGKEGYKFRESIDIKDLEKFVNDNRELLRRENKYFCHGDLSIGNMIFLKDKVKVIDLESVNINNFAFDIAFFITRMWQNKKYRKKVIETYLRFLPDSKKKTFKILFRINSAFIAYQALGTNPIEYTAAKNKERNLYFEKILKNSLKGFEFLLDNK